MFNFVKIFQKIKTDERVIKFLENNKAFFITVAVLIFFYDFTKEIFTLIDTFFKSILKENSEMLQLYNIFSWVVIFVIFLLILNFIICSKKNKKIKTKKVYFKPSEISIAQRIFILLPFIWLLVELFIYQYNSAYTLFELFINENDFEENLILPLTYAFNSIPFYQNGFSYFLYYVRFYFVGRNKLEFTYYTRYFYVQSFLIGTLYNFFLQLTVFIEQYSPFGEEFLELYQYLIFYTFFILTLYSMVHVILGKETNITFIDQAVQYHVGIRKPKK